MLMFFRENVLFAIFTDELIVALYHLKSNFSRVKEVLAHVTLVSGEIITLSLTAHLLDRAVHPFFFFLFSFFLLETSANFVPHSGSL